MNRILTSIIFIFCSFISANAQDCFQADLNLDSLRSSANLEFVTFFENDSIIKVCWWKKNTFRAEIYNDTHSIQTQIIKERPIEYVHDSITYRGHALRAEFYANNKKIEFYTLCD